MKKFILLAIMLAIFMAGCVQTIPEDEPEVEATEKGDLATFKSVEDVREYLQSTETSNSYGGGFGTPVREILLECQFRKGFPV